MLNIRRVKRKNVLTLEMGENVESSCTDSIGRVSAQINV